MAQTKRKRRSKHRGTAAGTIETRGRTGRPPSPEEKKKVDRAQAREKRMNTPPTWRSSAQRAGIAAALMFVFLIITVGGKKTSVGSRVGVAIGFAIVAFLLYTALGYYVDLYLWRRRMRKREAAK